MESRAWIGALAALGSIFFFGSYAVPIRLPSAEGINPVVFQAYKSLVCFTTAWPVLLFSRLKFTWWGVVGGAAWVATGTVAINAVKLAGIAPTQAIWSGLSIFVSYFWGAYVFNEHIRSEAMSYISLTIMALGMAGIAFSSSGKPSCWRSAKDTLMEVLLPDDKQQLSTQSQDLFPGFLYAVGVGLVNGSLMAPLKYATHDVVGVEYLVSFGIGALAASIFLLAFTHLIHKYRGQPKLCLHLGKSCFPALLAGLLWSMGNFFSIYATLYLGMTLAWPLVQCQILVSAFWAVFYFNEVSQPSQSLVLLMSTGLVVGGAVTLFLYGATS